MTKRVHLIACFLIATAMVGIGFDSDLAYADPVGNNGNHFGWYKNESIQYSQNNGENTNNGTTTAGIRMGLGSIARP